MNPKVEWGVMRTGSGKSDTWCTIEWSWVMGVGTKRTFDKKVAVKQASHLKSLFSDFTYTALKRRKND